MADIEEEEYQRRKKQRQQMIASMMMVAGTAAAVVVEIDAVYGNDTGEIVDHRTLPRGERRNFRHDQALMCINRDYCGPTVLFADKQFVRHFRIEPARFQRLFFDVGRSGIPYYINRFDGRGKEGASMEARLLLPLKTIAYGVPPHTFQDYFQMSETACSDCMDHFDLMMKKLYKNEYLRCLDEDDIKATVRLHKSVHKIDGMLGSLDCMHLPWDKCPVAWQGSYKNGKNDGPTLVAEAACDYHMWIHHVAFGYPGTLNDLNILSMSPLVEKMIDGTIAELENSVVPFLVGGETFIRTFLLVDGIYPPWSRFVRGIKEPVYFGEKKFTKWQESARKDIERAFGNLQAKFQFLKRPVVMQKISSIRDRVGTCVILHNMCVSDRVMEDVNARYRADFSVEIEEEEEVYQPEDLEQVQSLHKAVRNAVIGIHEGELTALEKDRITRRYLRGDLADSAEFERLAKAITKQKVAEARSLQYF